MDYMNLGLRSRKTGLTVDKSFEKDEHSMENLDEFFKEEQDSFIDMGRRRKSRKSSILPGSNMDAGGMRGTVNASSFDKEGFKIPSTVPEPGTSQILRQETPSAVLPVFDRRDSGLPQGYDDFPDIHAAAEDMVDEEEDQVVSSYRTPPKARWERRFNRDYRGTNVRDEESDAENEDFSVRLTPVQQNFDDYRDVPDLIDDGETTRDESFNTSENALLEDELDDDFRPGSEEEEDGEYVEDRSADDGSSGTDSDSSTSDFGSDTDDAVMNTARKHRHDMESASEVYDSDEDYIQTQAKDLLKSEVPLMKGGIRRSNRVKVSPLEYWRNERIVYKRKSDKPILEIDKIITYDHDQDAEEEELLKNKRAKKSVSKTKTRPYNYIPSGKPRGRPRKNIASSRLETDPNASILEEIKRGTYPNAEWLKAGVLQSSVNASVDHTKQETILAFAPGLSQTEQITQTAHDNFTLSILFDRHKERFASGMLKLPIDGEKNIADSQNAFINFFMVQGVVEVSVGASKFVCSSGSSFQIPAFNSYSFANKGNTEAQLYFVQVTVPDDFNAADDSFNDELDESPVKSSSDMSLTSA